MPELFPNNINPRKDLILCKRYEKPEKFGSIHIPDAFRKDNSFTLWEVIKVGTWGSKNFESVQETLAIELEEDMIIRTGIMEAIQVSCTDRELFLIPAKNVIFIDDWKNK